MTIRLPPSMTNTSESEVYTIDFREVAPLASHEKMFVANPDSARWGGLAIGVPGELRGLQKAHELWGSLPWKTLVQPSAELARGWKVQKELERRIEVHTLVFRTATCIHGHTSRCSNSLCTTFLTGRKFLHRKGACSVRAISSAGQPLHERSTESQKRAPMHSIRYVMSVTLGSLEKTTSLRAR